MSLTLVTGATGNVGTEVLNGLLTAQVPVRAAVLDPTHLERPLPAGAAPVAFDFTRAATWETALRGVERVFLMRPPALSNVERDMRPAIEAMRGAGVRHVVFMSLLGAERNRIVPHAKIETLLESVGMAWTFIRPGFFMQNLSTTHRAEIRDRGEIYIPAGSGVTSFTDVRDIAAVAVKALTEAGHEGQKYAITGAEALTYHEVAREISDVLGRSIRYVNPSLPAFLLSQRRSGKAWDYALVTTAIYATARFGLAGTLTDTFKRLMGREPIRLSQYVADYRAAWT